MTREIDGLKEHHPSIVKKESLQFPRQEIYACCMIPDANNLQPAKPALVVFCKYPNPGQVKTRLATRLGSQKAAGVYACLLRHTLHECSQIQDQAALILCTEPNATQEKYDQLLQSWSLPCDGLLFQIGDNLTERLSHMFANLLQLHPYVIVIGSDLPTLSANLLQQALQIMDRVVKPGSLIGPSSDGGFYLLGLNQWQQDLFAQISWSTQDTCGSLETNLRKTGAEILYIEEQSDVDTGQDLDKYLSLHKNTKLAAQIQNVLSSGQPLPELIASNK